MFIVIILYQDLKSEYLLPEIIDRQLKQGKARVKVLETRDQWYGITYQEDRAAVEEAIGALVKKGDYPGKLFG